MIIPECIIFEIPDILSQWVFLDIPAKKYIVGMLLACPIQRFVGKKLIQHV